MMARLRTVGVQQGTVYIVPRNPTTEYIPPGAAVTPLGCNRFGTNQRPGVIIFIKDLEDVHCEPSTISTSRLTGISPAG